MKTISMKKVRALLLTIALVAATNYAISGAVQRPTKKAVPAKKTTVVQTLMASGSTLLMPPAPRPSGKTIASGSTLLMPPAPRPSGLNLASGSTLLMPPAPRPSGAEANL